MGTVTYGKGHSWERGVWLGDMTAQLVMVRKMIETGEI